MVRIRLLELNELGGGGLEIKHMKYIGDDIFRKTRQFIYQKNKTIYLLEKQDNLLVIYCFLCD